MTFNKILVALLRSPEAETILKSALSVAQPEITEILLVHFIDWQIQDTSPWIGIGTLYDVGLSYKDDDRSYQRLQYEIEVANNWLKAKAEMATQSGFVCKYECHVGNCNTGIKDRAHDWKADLLVIGRRGRQNIAEMLLGSVSNYTIHHSPCSVLVVQGANRVEAEVISEVSQANN